jgi:threonylcarbamoyladenosine tRNA methylthiotransferase MtaB
LKKVAFFSLGCKVNSYETDAMSREFAENGFTVVSFDALADIYVINTCTVTAVADQKSRKMIRRAHRTNPAAVIVAAGCFVSTKQDDKDRLPINLIVTNEQKGELLFLVMRYISESDSCEKDIVPPQTSAVENFTPDYPLTPTPSPRTRAYIKIQDGCNQYCAYCIVPFVRGQERSRSKAEIIAEAKELIAVGFREIVLIGINLSAYGRDLSMSEALLSLLDEMTKIKGLLRVRLGSLEPGLITADFARRMAANEKVCPHFHISLQSGCDETLVRMNRHYTAGDYMEKVAMLRLAYEEIYGNDCYPALTTDIMVGFPGETDDEFRQTEDFVRAVGFAEIHVFQYSRRPGTAAAKMESHVTATVKKERTRRLHSLGETMAAEYRHRFVGRTVKAILEERKTIAGMAYWLGYTDEYIRVAVADTELLGEVSQGTVITASIIGQFGGELLGKNDGKRYRDVMGAIPAGI